MAMKFESLQDLFVHELREILDAEQQLTKALPKMIDAASLPYLKQKFTDHLKQSNELITNLEQVFAKRDMKAETLYSEGMAGLLKEGEPLFHAEGHPAVIDTALIAFMRKIEYYEFSSFAALRTYARALALSSEVINLLVMKLRDETKSDEFITHIAEASVGKKAA